MGSQNMLRSATSLRAGVAELEVLGQAEAGEAEQVTARYAFRSRRQAHHAKPVIGHVGRLFPQQVPGQTAEAEATVQLDDLLYIAGLTLAVRQGGPDAG